MNPAVSILRNNDDQFRSRHTSTIDKPHDMNSVFIDRLTFCNKQIHTLEGTHEYLYA